MVESKQDSIYMKNGEHQADTCCMMFTVFLLAGRILFALSFLFPLLLILCRRFSRILFESRTEIA